MQEILRVCCALSSSHFKKDHYIRVTIAKFEINTTELKHKMNTTQSTSGVHCTRFAVTVRSSTKGRKSPTYGQKTRTSIQIK